MNDLYREIMVKRPTTAADTLKKIGAIVLTVLLTAAGILINPLILLLAIGSGIMAHFVIIWADVEYEYLYVSGDIDIDKIMSKQRRKRVGSYALEQLEFMGPTGSHDLDPYMGNAPLKDYTSRDPHIPTYTAVYSGESGRQILKLELDAEIVEDMRRKAPRKVARY